MFSLLLPLNADAGRHMDAIGVPPEGVWRKLFHNGWRMVLRLIASDRQ
jgi:hypothetical protein